MTGSPQLPARPVAIVTGADSDIGQATAVALAAKGYDVGITWHIDHDGALAAARATQSLTTRLELRRMDLANLPDAAMVIDELIDELGRVDVYVGNTGTSHHAPFLELDFPTWRSVLAEELDSAFLGAQAAARAMVRQGTGGRIVNVTAVHGLVPMAGGAAYCAAKSGLAQLTKVMALELAEFDITVNAVAPGDAHSPVETKEVADMIAYLASRRSAYLNGASYVV